MSVYTPVTEAELAAWLGNYSVGTLAALEPIKAGIENTNYFVTTSQGRYVLTLFERLPAAELPFYLDLMAHLARHGIPCPAPIADLQDRYLQQLNGKPAALVTRLPGRSLDAPGERECGELGALLGRLHLAGRSYPGYLENPRGPKWWRIAAKEVMPFLKKDRSELLEKELRFQSEQRFPDLPRGPVHADLFRDNTLFEKGRISGVIDFYFAGVDCLLYDIAVCVNDWCLKDGAALDAGRTRALLAGCQGVRPFTPLEQAAWPAMLRAAALRFWLSRLHDYHLPRAGMLVHAHDPEHFRRILEDRVRAKAPWLA
ncbi:homoserine kinase [Betaproteobacteria bacterium SCGC AG-212-J23]|nr:homoserine kinase [Betaproteobacteria bacterium SCGC AG-212-J23]